jgi:hypothetical protein
MTDIFTPRNALWRYFVCERAAGLTCQVSCASGYAAHDGVFPNNLYNAALTTAANAKMLTCKLQSGSYVWNGTWPACRGITSVKNKVSRNVTVACLSTARKTGVLLLLRFRHPTFRYILELYVYYEEY